MTQRFASADSIYDIDTPGEPSTSSDGRYLAFAVTGSDRTLNMNTSTIKVADRESGSIVELCGGVSDYAPRWMPGTAEVSFIRTAADGDQVWTCTVGGSPRPQTNIADRVHHHTWSPCGRFLAVTFTSDLGPVDPTTRPHVLATSDYQRDARGRYGYPRANLGVWDRRHSVLQRLSDDLDVRDFAWSPDGQALAFCAVGTDDCDLTQPARLYLIDNPSQGQPVARQLTGVGNITAVQWHPDGQQVIVVGSDERPHVHDQIFAVARDGDAAPRNLTLALGRNVMSGGIGYPGARAIMAAYGDTLYFTARDHGCTALYALSNEAVRRIYGGDGVVVTGVALRATGELVLTCRTPGSYGQLVELIPSSGEVRDLYVPEPSASIHVREERWFESADGLPIQGWVISPGNSHLGSPPPLLVDIHGGPHSSWNAAADDVHLYQQELVTRGWRVLILNPRGSDGYGRDFSSGVDGAWGTNDSGDVLCAIDALVASGEADPDRLAITGYSYGGFLTCYLTSREQRFRAAVAGGVVTDLASWVATSDVGHYACVNYLGGYPWEDVERFATMSPSSRVHEVVTPTLILHGEDDLRTPLPQAVLWHTFLRGNGVDSDLVVYPGATHDFNFNGTPQQRIDYCSRLVAWLERWIAPSATSDN